MGRWGGGHVPKGEEQPGDEEVERPGCWLCGSPYQVGLERQQLGSTLHCVRAWDT